MSVNRVFTGQLEISIKNELREVNESLAKGEDVRARVSATVKFYGATLNATQYSDRPNENFVRLPYIVSYDITNIEQKVAGVWKSVPSRHASQSIGINIFCDRWYTGQGTLKAISKLEPLYLSDQTSFGEDVVDFFFNGHLTGLIDSRVRAKLASIQFASTSTELNACGTLGRNHFALDDPGDDAVEFNPPARRIVTKIATSGVAASLGRQVSVKLVSLKRLPAKAIGGGTLYSDVETPALQVFANHLQTFVPLEAIREGDVVTFDKRPMSMSRPADGQPLVLIANVIQNVAIGTEPTDSTFLVFGKETNFGNGTRTLRIRKSYTRPPTPPQTKPTTLMVDAYELTVKIEAFEPTFQQVKAVGPIVAEALKAEQPGLRFETGGATPQKGSAIAR